MDTIHLGRWDWLLLSIIIATFSRLLHWLVQHLASSNRRAGPSDRLWRQLLQIIEAPWFRQPLRVIYAVGIPMAALTWQGALTPRGLGLKSFPLMPTLQSSSERWGDDIGWFALLTTTTLTVIILGDWSARAKGTGHPETHKGGVFPNAFPGGLSDAAIEAVVHQAHWAFYREPFVVNWGLELGSWLGVMPVLLETVVNLMFWERIETDGNNRGYMRQMLIRGGLLAASTHLYLKTQSLWLAILMDIVVGWLLLPSSPAYMRSSFSHQSGDDNDSVRVDAVRIA